MDFWRVLEIEPTDNVSIVKKAYAKKLKLHHPEDDPEGYQTLREAYDSALKYLKNNKNSSSINERKVEKHEEIDNNGLRYCFFKEAPIFDYDAFLEYREEAFDALSNDDVEHAEECINNACNIYTDDPDLLLMKGKCCLLSAKCYFEFQEFDKAKKLLLQASYTDSLKKAEVHALLRKINLQLANKLREESRKDKKNKEIKLELNKLYIELGMLDNKQLIRKLSWKMAGRLFVCLLILVFQVMIIHSAMEGMGFRNINSIKNIGQFIMVKDKDYLIKDSQDINNLPGEISTVHGKLTHAGFMGLYRIPTKDKNKKPITVYLTSKEAHAKDLYGDMNGYVCIGTLGDKKVIMIVDYEEADQIYKTQTLDFKGIIRSMPADGLVSQVKKACITDKFESRFITDKLIDTKVKVSSIRQVILGIVSVMLLVQVLIIIQGLISGYMLVRANRKILNK